MIPKHLKWLLVLSLLLLGWFIRAYQIDVQEVFIDEGYHAARAVVLYDFEQHPARTANGKLGLYFWLGLFEPPYDATLRIFRLMVALPALLTGALVYRITRELDGGPGAALLALGLYMMLPFAFFFERLALADPFAAMFASAVAWRSIIFARRPNWQEGAVLGLLLAGATLAKLTMGLLPLLPVAASVLAVYQTGARGRALVAQGGQRYLLGLVVAAGVLTACWLPVFIPAGIAELNGEPFILVNPYNLEQIENADPWREAQNLVPMIEAYVHPLGLVVFAGALLYGLMIRHIRDKLIFLLVWATLPVALSLVAADLVRTRYLMPVAGPGVVIVALGSAHLWQHVRLARPVLALVGIVWLLGFTLPFAATGMTRPVNLPLSEADWNRYLSGNVSGEALREAAEALQRAEPTPELIYAPWSTCQLLYFYVQPAAQCLPDPLDPRSDGEALREALLAQMPPDEVAYVVIGGGETTPLFEDNRFRWEPIARYERRYVDRPVLVWRVRWAP